MKIINATLPRTLKGIDLYVFADFHIGDSFCDIGRVKTLIEDVKNNKNAYCILNGDIINNATKTSISDSYAEELTPMEQLTKFTYLFEPIKDKIIAVTQGNHEKRTYNKEGIDITRLVCKQLGIEDKYSATGALIFLRVGETLKSAKETNGSGLKRQICYTIYATHGSGGGRKEGAKIIRLADMASIIDTDLYIHGHSHLPMIMRQSYYRVDPRNNACAIVDKLFVNTSSQLNYGGYGQSLEFKPTSKESPIIYLNGTKKEFKAKL